MTEEWKYVNQGGDMQAFIGKQLERIADALEHLVEQGRILKDSKAIAKVLKAEDQQFNKESLEINEEVLMDLTEVTVMVITEKAVLFTKKGYQKWVPLSTIEDGVPLEEGGYLEDIELTPQGEKWIPDKAWEKLVVAKK